MNNGTDFDFIIIGSGAGGGTLAYKLAPSGKRNSPHRTRPFRAAREGELELSRSKCARSLQYEGTLAQRRWYRAASAHELLCRRKHEVLWRSVVPPAGAGFGEIKHHGGVSPAWPISYDELEPYYNDAERIYHVHGQALGEDPTEPRRSGAYPYSAISHEPRIQQLSEDFAAHGLKPFHTPLGVMLDEANPQKSPCIRCSTCDGFRVS